MVVSSLVVFATHSLSSKDSEVDSSSFELDSSISLAFSSSKFLLEIFISLIIFSLVILRVLSLILSVVISLLYSYILVFELISFLSK
ncbi:MAG: hypothetical protein UCV58_20080 [Clostridium saudiense]|nr:hypothetical protein [Clostridium saudiense]